MSNPFGEIQICNLALLRIGSSQVIASFGETSNESALCALYYPFCRDELLRAFPWPWASKFAALVQVSAVGVRANAQWNFSYRYPTDCLFVRRLDVPATDPAVTTPPLNFVSQVYPWRRADGDPTPWPFVIGNDSNGKLIYTDLQNAACEYTVAFTDATQFATDFASLLAWRLAVELAYGLAVNDKRREIAMEAFEREKGRVRSQALNEGQSDQPWMTYQSEVIRSRYSG